jgi:serine protease Do
MRKRKATSLGSGFYYRPFGLYRHQFSRHSGRGRDYRHFTGRQRTFPLTVVGRDKKTDLALLKVDSKMPLTAVTWAIAKKFASATGSGHRQSVRPWRHRHDGDYLGARRRNINSGPYDEYLQTDAAHQTAAIPAARCSTWTATSSA